MKVKINKKTKKKEEVRIPNMEWKERVDQKRA